MPRLKFLACAGAVMLSAFFCGCDVLSHLSVDAEPEATEEIQTVILSTPEVTARAANVSRYPDNREVLQQRIVDEEISIREMQQDVRDGLYSYEDLTRFYMERMENNDVCNAVLTVFPTAIAAAQKCDQENLQSSPLYGIPFVLDDNIDTRDVPTTCGAYALADRRPTENAFLVGLLISQGAIPLAKTNLDELGGSLIGDAALHFSALGGELTSPHGTDSGASGAALAAATHLAPLAVGLDTNGTLLEAGALNRVVCIRPSHALVSREGVIPVNTAYDVPGAVGLSVEDATWLLYGMQGASTEDGFQQTGKYVAIGEPDTFLPADTASALAGTRILLDESATRLPEEVFQALRDSGAVLIEDLAYDPLEGAPSSIRQNAELVFDFGVRDSLETYFSTQQPVGISSIQRLAVYNRDHAENAIPHGQTRLEYLLELSDRERARADEVSIYLADADTMDWFLEQNNIDLILSADADIAQHVYSSLNPCVSIPCARGTKNLSATFTARNGYDEKAIRAAYVVEQLLANARVQP